MAGGKQEVGIVAGAGQFEVEPPQRRVDALNPEIEVSRQVRTLRRMLARRATIPTILAALPPGVTLDTTGMNEEEAAGHIAEVLDTLGTNYEPSCLSTCPLAFTKCPRNGSRRSSARSWESWGLTR